MKLLFLVNMPEFFISHRLPLAVAAMQNGFEVHVATGPGADVEKIKGYGFVHHLLPLSRSGVSWWKEFFSLFAIWQVVRKVRPTVLHAVTIKAVIYGGLVTRVVRVKGMVAAISGLGAVFSEENVSPSWFKLIIIQLYRLALHHKNLRVIFQNTDDLSVFQEMGAVRSDQVVLIRGSGVDLTCFPIKSEPEGICTVTLACRLLKDKGVYEFIDAANQLSARGVKCRFLLVGDMDPGNPCTVDRSDIEEWKAEGVVEVLGFSSDVAGIFSNSNVVVLPSYREGFPKVLIEAAAAQRAVITTDRPGCRDAIIPGESGVLVPAKDSVALADAIQTLTVDPLLRRSMGIAGRKLAEREFSIYTVIDAHLRIYKELSE